MFFLIRSYILQIIILAVTSGKHPRIETAFIDFAYTARHVMVTYAGCYDISVIDILRCICQNTID